MKPINITHDKEIDLKCRAVMRQIEAGTMAVIGGTLSPYDHLDKVARLFGGDVDVAIGLLVRSPSTTSGQCGCDGPTRIDPNCPYHAWHD